MGETIELPLDDITLDVDLQPRVKIDKRLVEDYVYAIADGATMPPVTVVRDGEKHWLADGYHRFHAFETLQLPTIPADVREGNTLDAVLISLRANAEHGKRRQAGDYRKAFAIARRFNLVSATDSDAVATFLRCSMRTAQEADQRVAPEGTEGSGRGDPRREGQRQEQPRDRGRTRRRRGHDPLLVAKRCGKTVSGRNPARQRNGRAGHARTQTRSARPQRVARRLEALRKINEQAEVSAMFADRYTRFDHVFGPELERAHAWITELHRRFFDG